MVLDMVQVVQWRVPIVLVIIAGLEIVLHQSFYNNLIRCDMGFIHCVKHGATAYHHGIGKVILVNVNNI